VAHHSRDNQALECVAQVIREVNVLRGLEALMLLLQKMELWPGVVTDASQFARVVTSLTDKLQRVKGTDCGGH